MNRRGHRSRGRRPRFSTRCSRDAARGRSSGRTDAVERVRQVGRQPEAKAGLKACTTTVRKQLRQSKNNKSALHGFRAMRSLACLPADLSLLAEPGVVDRRVDFDFLQLRAEPSIEPREL